MDTGQRSLIRHVQRLSGANSAGQTTSEWVALMTTVSTTLDEVKDIIVKTLDIEDRRRVGDARTQLFGGIPELDSFAVISLAMALEERFGFEIAG